MKKYFRSTIELTILFPGMLLAFLPVKQYLRMRPAKLAALMVPLLTFLCLAGGTFRCVFSVRTLWLFFPITLIAGTAYVNALTISRWKSVSVFLAVCASFSCLGGAAIAINDIVSPENPVSLLSPAAAAIWFLMCCTFVAAFWYPASHAARRLLEEEAFAQTWYVFWILPVLFIGLLFEKQDISFTFQLDLPAALPVPEIDLCLVMSNLLENALEANLRTEPSKRRGSMQACLHSDHMLLLSVENAFEGDIMEKNGVFQSSKRRGDGVGLQSVRHIAEKNGGYCRFLYKDGVFRANVILRV